jgi:hypothetical protein
MLLPDVVDLLTQNQEQSEPHNSQKNLSASSPIALDRAARGLMQFAYSHLQLVYTRINQNNLFNHIGAELLNR